MAGTVARSDVGPVSSFVHWGRLASTFSTEVKITWMTNVRGPAVLSLGGGGVFQVHKKGILGM